LYFGICLLFVICYLLFGICLSGFPENPCFCGCFFGQRECRHVSEHDLVSGMLAEVLTLHGQWPNKAYEAYTGKHAETLRNGHLVPTLCVGTHPGRSASNACHTARMSGPETNSGIFSSVCVLAFLGRTRSVPQAFQRRARERARHYEKRLPTELVPKILLGNQRPMGTPVIL